MSLLDTLLPRPATTAPATAPARPASAEPALTPRYELDETPEGFALVVELPGVAKDGLDISVDHERIRIVGRRAWSRPEAWTALHRETRDATYELELDHGRAVETDQIHAELRDGILRVALPKAEALKPRRVPVT